MSVSAEELQKMLDELERSRRSRRRAWENLQEIRWILKDAAGIELEPPPTKTIDAEGRLVRDAIRRALSDRQGALLKLVDAIRHYRKVADSKPLTLQGSEYALAVEDLDLAIRRAAELME